MKYFTFRDKNGAKQKEMYFVVNINWKVKKTI